MAFPVIATVKNCFTRIPRDWDIIWRYLQVPFLLCCLFGCVMLGVYALVGPDVFIATETSNGHQYVTQTLWYWIYFTFGGYGFYLFYVPFVITWGRYVMVGHGGLEGRQSWSWGKAEWLFVKGVFVWFLVTSGWFIVFGLVAASLLFVGSALVTSSDLVNSSNARYVGIVNGALVIGAFLTWVFYVTRLNVCFVSLAHGAPFRTATLWAVTKGKVIRYLGGVLLIGIGIATPTLLIESVLTSIVFEPGRTGQLKAQLLLDIFLVPLTAISVPTFMAYYAEVWRFAGGHEEWSGAAATGTPPITETTPA